MTDFSKPLSDIIYGLKENEFWIREFDPSAEEFAHLNQAYERAKILLLELYEKTLFASCGPTSVKEK